MSLEARARADLHAAMARRDMNAVRALRTLLAAFANAEAPAVRAGEPPSAPVVGRLVEHDRLVLDDADRRAIVRHEITDRLDSAAQFARAGRDDEAGELRAQIALLEAYL